MVDWLDYAGLSVVVCMYQSIKSVLLGLAYERLMEDLARICCAYVFVLPSVHLLTIN
jgi:hypothetical protein